MKTIKWLSILVAGFIIQIIVSDNITVIGNLNATDVIEIEKHKFDGDLPAINPRQDEIRFDCEPFYDFEIDYSDDLAYYIKDKRNNRVIESGWDSLELDSDQKNIVHASKQREILVGSYGPYVDYDLITTSTDIKLCIVYRITDIDENGKVTVGDGRIEVIYTNFVVNRIGP